MADGGSPVVVALVAAVTSAPVVSSASTLACASNVVLKTAVDTAKEPVSAMITTALDRIRCCLDIEAATTPESPPAIGFASLARARRPRASTAAETCHGTQRSDEDSLRRREPGDAARGRAPDPEQGLFQPAAFPARGRYHGREERGEERARHAEEQEEQLRVERVAPARVELRA